jgi:hypothetical protein
MSLFKQTRFKSWFLAAIAFAIWAISIDFLWTRLVIDRSTMSEAARVNHLILEHGSEIPVFGPSTAICDYDPEILGDDVFNYGMKGASMDAWVTLLQIECNKHKRTPIVLDLSPMGFRGMGDKSRFAPFARQPEIRQMLKREGFMEWRYWVPGLRYFGYYDWYLKDYLAEHLFATKKAVGGYTIEFNEKFDRNQLDADITNRLKLGFGYQPFADQERRLFELIRSTPQRTFVMVFAPMHSSCYTNFVDPQGFARHLDQLRSFTNAVVLNWGRMELPDECFEDTTHLNREGAIRFSRRLADQLKIIRATVNSNNYNISGSHE